MPNTIPSTNNIGNNNQITIIATSKHSKTKKQIKKINKVIDLITKPNILAIIFPPQTPNLSCKLIPSVETTSLFHGAKSVVKHIFTEKVSVKTKINALKYLSILIKP